MTSVTFKFRLEIIESPSLRYFPFFELLSIPSNNTSAVPIEEYFSSLNIADTRQLLHESFSYIREHNNIGISINTNKTILSNPMLLAEILSEMKAISVSNHIRFALEINENCVNLLNDTYVSPLIESMRSSNIAIWLDDFGSGEASFLSTVKNKFDAIKLDKNLFWFLYDSHIDLLAELIRVLNDKSAVIVEGIETTEQLKFIFSHNCHGQGYLFRDSKYLTE